MSASSAAAWLGRMFFAVRERCCLVGDCGDALADPEDDHLAEWRTEHGQIDGASAEGALPAVVSHGATLRTAPVDALTDCVRADSQFSKNKQNHRQG